MPSNFVQVTSKSNARKASQSSYGIGLNQIRLIYLKRSDDDSGFRHSFGTEASLPLAQSAPAVSHDITRLCQIVVTLYDAVRALSWIFSMYILLSDGRSPRLVKKTEVGLHPTSIGNIFVIQPFLTHCSGRSLYFSNLR